MQTSEIGLLIRMRRAVERGDAKLWREAARLSLSEVAAACGVTSATVWRWENAERVPRGAAALEYAKVLNRIRQAGKSE